MQTRRRFHIRQAFYSSCLAATTSLAGCGSETTVEPEPIQLVCTIPTDDIFAGAAGRDAIPALSDPEIARATSAAFMRDSDRVLGVEINGEARAYPFGILWWHEVINDTIGGQPVLITYCPLTGSGIAFNPTVQGATRNFGVSGLLYLSNLIMFDRESNSLWNQMGLGAQCGPDRGLDLSRLAITETDWIHWKNVHPNTTVITPNTGFGNRPYFEYPYPGYDDINNNFVDFLPSGISWSDELLTKDLVLGVFDGGAARAYPLRILSQAAVSTLVNDVVGSLPVLVTHQSQWNTAQAFDRRVNGKTLTFSLVSEGPLVFVDGETGTEWNQRGEAVAGPLVGERMERVTNSFVSFWFAWSLYFPNTSVAR